MKTYLILGLFLMFGYGVHSSCYIEWLFDPDDELCEPGAIWHDLEECVTCLCLELGFSKDCCDMSPYPVVRDTVRCEAVREDCEWRIKPKEPKWEQLCREDGGTLIG